MRRTSSLTISLPMLTARAHPHRPRRRHYLLAHVTTATKPTPLQSSSSSTSNTSPNSSGPDAGAVASSLGAATTLRGARGVLVHFLSGGLAAGGVRAALQPLDTCKTRLQSGGLASLSVRGLYRGVVPGVLGIIPAAAVYMAVFQFCKRRIREHAPVPMRGHIAVAGAAALGDIAASLVRAPCEALKQRTQVGVYRNLTHALKMTKSWNGLRGLYGGLGAQLARDIPYAAVEFVVYERMRRDRSLGGRESVAIGALAGAAAAIMSNPMDVVKTRLMTQTELAGMRRYKGVWHALRKVAREEGVVAFGKGLAPRIVSKTLQSALFFAAYEVLRQRFTSMLAKKEDGAAG